MNFTQTNCNAGDVNNSITAGVTLTPDEAEAIYELIDELSGGNADNVFANDGTDTLDDVRTRAAAKVFKAAGEDIPSDLWM